MIYAPSEPGLKHIAGLEHSLGAEQADAHPAEPAARWEAEDSRKSS